METQSEYGFREQREVEERKKWEEKAKGCPARYLSNFGDTLCCNSYSEQCKFKTCFGRYWR